MNERTLPACYFGNQMFLLAAVPTTRLPNGPLLLHAQVL